VQSQENPKTGVFSQRNFDLWVQRTLVYPNIAASIKKGTLSSQALL